MSSKNKGLLTLCIPLLILLAVFTGCEDPGSVGSGLVNNSKLVFDTLSITDIQELEFKGYSGQTTYLPIGKYSDPVFGNIQLQGLIKPTIQNVFVDSGGNINENHSMKLQLSFDTTRVYGDTLAESSFTLYEITSRWRGTSWKMNDTFTYDDSNPVGSFTVEQQEEIIVDLADSWKDKYATYFNMDSTSVKDSLYKNEFYGLAIISDDNNRKIDFPQMGPSRFLVITETEQDTAIFNAGDWGYTLSRTDTNFAPNTIPLHTTAETAFRLDTTQLNLDYFRSGNFTSARLIFNEAADYLNQSLPPDEVRLGVSSLKLDIGYSLELLYELQFGRVEFNSTKNDSLNQYTFDITMMVNDYLYGSLDEPYLYVGIGSGSGQLRSTLIYNENAPELLRPRIVVTRFSEEDE